jgi:hypothetical protein
VADIKDKELNPNLEFDSENTHKRQIIDVDRTAIVATTSIQTKETIDPEEEESLFYSYMWVKVTPLHFIVDNVRHKKLISIEVIK